METLYIKVGKKYNKVGTTMTHDYMHDGLWLVQSHPGSKEYNNLAVRLCDLPSGAEVQKYMKAYLNKNAIINAINKLHKSGTYETCSLTDYAEAIVNEVYAESMNQPQPISKKQI